MAALAPTSNVHFIDIQEGAAPAATGDRSSPLLDRQHHLTVEPTGGNLLQRVSAVLGVGAPRLIRCQVCFEEVPATATVALDACGHSFCRVCLTTYLEVNIRDGQIYPRCFFEEVSVTSAGGDDILKQIRRCGMPINPSDITRFVSQAVLEKYNTFRFNHENELGRQCPFCFHSQVCEGPHKPACICVNCGSEFCFVHANAHSGSSCEAYERKHARDERKTHSELQRISKECPKCRTKIEKDGGCNHLKCSRCYTDFCWLCGAIIEDSELPNHFQWWNLTGCAGLMRVEIQQETVGQRALSRFISLVNFVIIGPVSFVLTIILTVVTLGCLPCMLFGEMSFRTSFLLGMEFCAWFLVLPIEFVVLVYKKCKSYLRKSRRDDQPEPEAAINRSESLS